LAVWANTDSLNTTLIVSVANDSPVTTIVTGVTFDGEALAQAVITPEGNFTNAVGGGLQLLPGPTGELSIGKSALNVTSRMDYTIGVITKAGNDYLTTIAWP